MAVRGDRILWGQSLTGDMRRRKAKGGGSTGGGKDGEEQSQPDNSSSQDGGAEAVRRRQEEDSTAGGRQVNGTRAGGIIVSYSKFRSWRKYKVKGRSRGERRKARHGRLRIKKRKIVRQKENNWYRKQKMLSWEKYKMNRQGGHQGAVGKVKCGEGKPT